MDAVRASGLPLHRRRRQRGVLFVREGLAGPVLDGLDDVRVWPPRHRDSRDDGQMASVRGIHRSDQIADLPVVDLSRVGRWPCMSCIRYTATEHLKIFGGHE